MAAAQPLRQSLPSFSLAAARSKRGGEHRFHSHACPHNAYPTVYCSPLIPNGKLGAVPQGAALFLFRRMLSRAVAGETEMIEAVCLLCNILDGKWRPYYLPTYLCDL